MTDEIYRYKAFISYRHVERDRGWASWLVEKLETYRTPRALVSSGTPARIGKIFRDDDEVPASTDLTRQIEDALRASQFLIVVSSRDTPQSMWVRQEIDFFRAIGGGDRILALLVDGEPSEAFPANLMRLRDDGGPSPDAKSIERLIVEPIAADVRQRSGENMRLTRRRAFLRLAAGLLGVTFDDLARRDDHRRLQRRMTWFVVAAILLVGAAGAYLTTMFAQNERMEEAWIVHTYQSIGSLQAAISDLERAESFQRGFIVTRQSDYTDGYRGSFASARTGVGRFGMLNADDPEQQARVVKLSALIRERGGQLDEDIRLAAAGPPAAQALLRSMEQGRVTMENFYGTAAEALGRELELLKARIAARHAVEETEIDAALATAAIVLLGLIAMAVLGGTRPISP